MDDRALRPALTDPLPLERPPDAEALAALAHDWRQRERALRRHAPALAAWIEVDPQPTLPAGLHAELEPWLPIGALRRALHGALQPCFANLLAGCETSLEQAELARARSWVEARRRLRALATAGAPSAVFDGLTEPQRAQALLAELFAPPGYGTSLGRYAEAFAALRPRLAGRAQLRVWDAGTATGEGLWELCALGLTAGAKVEALGTDRCGVQLRLAASWRRPHAPAQEAELDALRRTTPGLDDPARCQVRWERHDLLEAPPPPGPWDLITCHGLLGEGVRGAEPVARALRNLAAPLAPGGLLSLADRFRDDRQRETSAWIRAADPAGLGLRQLAPGLYRRA